MFFHKIDPIVTTRQWLFNGRFNTRTIHMEYQNILRTENIEGRNFVPIFYKLSKLQQRKEKFVWLVPRHAEKWKLLRLSIWQFVQHIHHLAKSSSIRIVSLLLLVFLCNTCWKHQEVAKTWFTLRPPLLKCGGRIWPLQFLVTRRLGDFRNLIRDKQQSSHYKVEIQTWCSQSRAAIMKDCYET